MIVVQTKMKRMPRYCRECPLVVDMSRISRENWKLTTGTAMKCGVTRQLIYYEDYEGSRPDTCPLVEIEVSIKGQNLDFSIYSNARE
jgi:hypothetical protein